MMTSSVGEILKSTVAVFRRALIPEPELSAKSVHLYAVCGHCTSGMGCDA
jgi:hypothetical protein